MRIINYFGCFFKELFVYGDVEIVNSIFEGEGWIKGVKLIGVLLLEYEKWWCGLWWNEINLFFDFLGCMMKISLVDCMLVVSLLSICGWLRIWIGRMRVVYIMYKLFFVEYWFMWGYLMLFVMLVFKLGWYVCYWMFCWVGLLLGFLMLNMYGYYDFYVVKVFCFFVLKEIDYRVLDLLYLIVD